jgi:methyl-accepting chemotaxis protein
MADTTRGKVALDERLDFIGMDQKARVALVKLRPLLNQALGPALDAFYKKVRRRRKTIESTWVRAFAAV